MSSESQAPSGNALVSLVQSGQLEPLADRWKAAVTEAPEPKADLLEALDALVKVGNTDKAAELATAWIQAHGGRIAEGTPLPALKSLLALARELLVRVDHQDLRKSADTLYRLVHAGVGWLEASLSASGLVHKGEHKKTHPRKAVRICEAMFSLSIGSFVGKRGEDRVGQVTDIEVSTAEATVRLQKGTDTLTPAELADNWEPVHAMDYRVLEQLQPGKAAELAKENPGALIAAIVRARGGRVDSMQLKKVLVPRVLAASAYDGWWTKARASIKNDPHLKLEGRSPVIITYEAGGRSPTAELTAAFDAAKGKGVAARLEAVAAYKRDCTRRKVEPDAELVKRMNAEVAAELAAHLAKSPSDLDAAVQLDKIEAEAGLESSAKADGGWTPKVLKTLTDPVPAFVKLDESAAWTRALAAARDVWPDTWTDLYLKLLPQVPPAVADQIAAKLVAAGRLDDVKKTVKEIYNNPGIGNLPGLIWLWKGPAEDEKLALPAKSNLLTRLLDLLSRLGASDGQRDAANRDARAAIKSALQARNHESFRALLTGANKALAKVVRRQVERCDALGPSLREDLTGILRELFREIFVVAKPPPWEEKEVIWTTEKGLAKKNAEHEELVNVKMLNNAKAIAAAREHGDLRENADYTAALEERDVLRARQAELQRDMIRARVITPELIPVDHVGVGSRVLLRNNADQAEHTVTLLGPWDADRERNIYPYGVAMYRPLLGCKVGEDVDLSLSGQKGNYHVVKIERGLPDEAYTVQGHGGAEKIPAAASH